MTSAHAPAGQAHPRADHLPQHHHDWTQDQCTESPAQTGSVAAPLGWIMAAVLVLTVLAGWLALLF